MDDPWKIIGWIILSFLALWVIKKLAVAMRRLLIATTRYYLHMKTRSIPPEEGQEWWQNGEVLHIGKRWPKGHFTVHIDSSCSRISWPQTDKEWQERVKSRRLFLIKLNA